MERMIITAAITGAIHTPSMSPYLPLTPEQIIDECIANDAAGAAVAHIHVRDPLSGRPTADRRSSSRSPQKSRSDAMLFRVAREEAGWANPWRNEALWWPISSRSLLH